MASFVDDDLNVFVYGSLRKGLHNHHYLESSVFRGNFTTVDEFYLIGLKSLAYPYLLTQKVQESSMSSFIQGEVYKITGRTLLRLDELEGHPHHYMRTRIRVRNARGEEITVHTYLLRDASTIEEMKRGPSVRFDARFVPVNKGDWVDFLASMESAAGEEEVDEEDTGFASDFATVLSYWNSYKSARVPQDERIMNLEMFRSSCGDLVAKYYRKLHPEMYQIESTPGDILDPSFLKLVEDYREGKVSLEERKERYAGFGLVDVSTVFTPSWCLKLIEECDNFQQWAKDINLPIERPNSMNIYGVILSYMGFDQFFRHFIDNYVLPVSSVELPEQGGNSIVGHHAFTVEYRAGGGEGETELAFHVDQADVTLNVCLGQEFTGGDLYFHGQRCHLHTNTGGLGRMKLLKDKDLTLYETTEYEHRLYQGILHGGKNRHGARRVASGRRVNLILWMYSDEEYHKSIAAHQSCPPWCALNRSHESDWTLAYKVIPPDEFFIM